jgi:hypothetical protein
VKRIGASLVVLALGIGAGVVLRAEPPRPATQEQEGVAKPDATLDVLHFKAPAGWKRLDQQDDKSSLTYLAPDSAAEQPALIRISIGEPAQGELELSKALERSIAESLRGYKPDRPLIQASVDEQGYPAASCRVMAWEPSGAPFFASFYALDLNKRPAVISYIDRSNAPGIEKRKAAFDELVAGHVVGDGSAVAGAPLVVGEQPLTQQIVDRSADRLQLALDLKLTAEQRGLFRKAMKKFWVDSASFRGSYLIQLDLWEQAIKRGGRQRVLATLRARAEMLADFCQHSDEPFARSIVASYAEAHGGKGGDGLKNGGQAIAAAARDGLPQLGAGDVEHYADFAQWGLGVRLSPQQRQALGEQLAREWPRGGWVAQPTAVALRAWDALSRLSAADRDLIAVYFRMPYLRTVQYTIIDSQRLLKKAYDEQHQPLASGVASLYEPPLTRDVTDAYAELICFQANAVIGKQAFEPTAAAKETAARGLAAGYTDFSGRLKYALAAMPQVLAETKLAWPLLAEEDRRAWREQWAPWFAPVGVKPGAAPPVPDAAALLEQVVGKERSDDDAYKKTPLAGMWAVIQAKAVSQRDQAAYNTFINAMRDRYGDAYESRYGSAPAR